MARPVSNYVPYARPVTTLVLAFEVDDTDDWDHEKYEKAMAENTGVPKENVAINSQRYIIEMGYKMTGNQKFTKDDAEAAVSKGVGVSKEEVECTISRRLSSSSVETTI